MTRRLVCFVDDDPAEVAIFESVFGRGFRVVAGTGLAAVVRRARTLKRRPDLFVLDLYFAAGPASTPAERRAMIRLKAQVDAAQARLDRYLSRIGQSREGGLKLMRAIERRYPGVPVVFYTRKGTLADAEACLEAGAKAVLKKPQPRRLAPGQDVYAELLAAAKRERGRIAGRLDAIAGQERKPRRESS